LNEEVTEAILEALRGNLNMYTDRSLWTYLKEEHTEVFKLIEHEKLVYIDGGHRGGALKRPQVRMMPEARMKKKAG